MSQEQEREEHKWEDLNQSTRRMQVPGGYIYETWGYTERSVVFVPDPRQQIAAQCLQGLLADSKLNYDAETFAELAVDLADALLVQLGKEPTVKEPQDIEKTED